MIQVLRCHFIAVFSKSSLAYTCINWPTPLSSQTSLSRVCGRCVANVDGYMRLKDGTRCTRFRSISSVNAPLGCCLFEDKNSKSLEVHQQPLHEPNWVTRWSLSRPKFVVNGFWFKLIQKKLSSFKRIFPDPCLHKTQEKLKNQCFDLCLNAGNLANINPSLNFSCCPPYRTTIKAQAEPSMHALFICNVTHKLTTKY